MNQQKDHTDESGELVPDGGGTSAPFIDDTQQIASEDPLVVEAEKLFGKDFVEVYED